MSLGALKAGIDVKFAIEKDPFAAETYRQNHPNTELAIADIATIKDIPVSKRNCKTVLFGGPPCQGFSTSNQRTRGLHNESNWLFNHFVRLLAQWKPDWFVFENVRGFKETANGFFYDAILRAFADIGYNCFSQILCASNFGVPQVRPRLFIVGSLKRTGFTFPQKLTEPTPNVSDALLDLPKLPNGARFDFLNYGGKPKSPYAAQLRMSLKGCSDHYVTRSCNEVLNRYGHIPQGGNWSSIPSKLMRNYKDSTRCHVRNYFRLKADQPSVVLANFRKTMLVHPWDDRGLSVREAARLQSFPDCYTFSGSIGFRQQQVANAVPPIIAQFIFQCISEQS